MTPGPARHVLDFVWYASRRQPVNRPSAIALILLCAWAQSRSSAQVQQSSSDSSLVIRATTRLVQVDAVVTDSSGHPVKDLSASDFSILEDGKPQKVSFFTLYQPALWMRPSWPAPNISANMQQCIGSALQLPSPPQNPRLSLLLCQ